MNKDNIKKEEKEFKKKPKHKKMEPYKRTQKNKQ